MDIKIAPPYGFFAGAIFPAIILNNYFSELM